MRQFLKSSLSLVFAAGLVFSAHAGEAPMQITGATTVDAEGVIALIESSPDLIILDNRSVADFDAGHIEGAVRLIDTDIKSEDDLAAHVADKETSVLFYCNGLSCGRAAKAAEMAIEYGYTKVNYYALGMTEWRSLGLPLVTR